MKCRALLTEFRLFWQNIGLVCRALLSECSVLLSECRALLILRIVPTRNVPRRVDNWAILYGSFGSFAGLFGKNAELFCRALLYEFRTLLQGSFVKC